MKLARMSNSFARSELIRSDFCTCPLIRGAFYLERISQNFGWNRRRLSICEKDDEVFADEEGELLTGSSSEIEINIKAVTVQRHLDRREFKSKKNGGFFFPHSPEKQLCQL